MSYRRKNKYHYKEEKRTQIVFSNEPLSLSGSTSTDIRNEKLLSNVLSSAGRLKEDKQQAQEREYVLQDLDQICQEWVCSSARKHNHPEEFVSNSRVRLFAFGSYKLDVHSLGDDVDLLCVGPNFLTRDMFFDELGVILQENSCIKNFYAVRNAYVPVMSFKYNNIDIDMVYAQLQIELLDMEWNINDDRNLKNLDPTSILSLNGVRLAHKTLELVPNKKAFRLSLRAIRYWAKQRGIYSNKLGYLGGVSWAILIARVCQLYPNANSSQIVQNFFLFYHIWNFGTPLKAITLCNIVQHEDMPSIKVWDPNDQQTKYELMHIITPAFPAMNSTHNVSMSTFEVLKREIARAFHMLSRAQKEITEDKWRELFQRNTFFIDHKNYIFVKACAPYKNLTEWSGLIESKIRSFVNNLEQHPDAKVTPFCKAIKLKLKQSDINKHTHPQILKQIEIKRKEKIKKQKEKKRLKKLQKQQALKQKQAQEKLRKQQMEKLEAAAAAQMQIQVQVQTPVEKSPTQNDSKDKMELDTENNNSNNKVEIDVENKQNNTESTPEQDSDKTASLPPMNENDTTPPLTALNPPTLMSTKSASDSNLLSQISINDGSSVPVMKLESNKPKENSTPLPQHDEHGVVIVSNLSLPIEKFEPEPVAVEPEPAKSNPLEKPKTVSRSTTPVIRPGVPSNPYIYVAPELQRKYTYKSRNRRPFYGNRRNRFYGNRVYNITSPSPATSTTAGSTGEKKDGETKDDKDGTVEGSVSASASASGTVTAAMSMVSPQINVVNPHAFVVGKNQIACCESFNNKILKEKAEKNIGYECRAFVIGLKVVNRVLAIDTTADGQQLEQVAKFDFSRSVVHFLKGLNHIYTDSHIIIELVNCNKVPHFLFPQYEYKRPAKDFIKNHQELMELNHIKWRSKSCMATLGDDTKKALTPKMNGKSGVNENGNNEVEVEVVKGSKVSQTPKFDKDDILMNDDSMEAMPGLGLPPAQVNGNENMDLNMEVESSELKKGRKRKVSDIENECECVSTQPSVEPENKKRKLMDDVIDENDGEVVENNENCKATIIGITEVSEPAVNVAVVPIENKNNSDDIGNIHNPYFEKINWDKKFDNSLTFEYAVTLYKKSQNFVSWGMVSHSLTATATHVYNTCNDQTWKIKLKKVLSNQKYGWNGCKYQVQLNKKLMFDLAHDIAYNYIQHKNEKKRKRKF